MNNLKNKIQNNVNDYTNKLTKKHPNLKNQINDDNNDDSEDSMANWLGAIIAVVFIIALGFIVFQMLSSGLKSTISLKLILLSIEEFL